MNKTIKQINNQRGSALLLTLGILSLVLILAMSFAFTARTNRQVAKVNADQIKARLLAESALERVIAAMKHNMASTYPPTGVLAPNWPDNSMAFAFSYAANASPPWRQYYLVSKQDGGGNASNADYDDLTDLGSLNISLPITQNITAASRPTQRGFQNKIVNGETVGRIAFLVLEEANKFDINQMLSLNSRIPFVDSVADRLAPFRESWTASQLFFDILGDGTPPPPASPPSITFSEADTVRLGLQMQELHADARYFSALQRGFWHPSDSTQQTMAHWFSYSHLWNRLGKTDTSQGAYDGAGVFANTIGPDAAGVFRYTFFSGEDIEAYWDGTTERQRFDLTGIEWRSSAGGFYDPAVAGKYSIGPNLVGWSHGGTLAGAKTLVERLVRDSQRAAFFLNPAAGTVAAVTPNADPPTGVGFGIPYLNTLETATPNQGKQVAANMIDFCDGDSYATTDFTLTAPGTPAVHPDITYCGNEKVAYFNEVKIDIIGYRTTVDPAATPVRYEPRLTLRPRIELVNIFAEDCPAGYCFVRVYGSYTIYPDVIGAPTTGVTRPFGDGEQGYVDIPLGDRGNVPALSYLEHTGAEVPLYPTAANPYPTPRTPNQVGFEVEITQVVMYSSSVATATEGALFDVGFISGLSYKFDDPTPALRRLVPTLPVPGVSMAQPLVYEARDPRVNHVSSCWGRVPPPNFIGTFGADNLNFQPNDVTDDSIDYEQGVTFMGASKNTFSTAFIPNRPFRSLWELGAIHRGEPYRTLNIANTDKEILDQVKIGPIKRTRGKFNLNSVNPATVLELLRNIDVTVGYEGVNNSEVATVNTAPSPLPASPCSYSRGDFATVLAGYYSAGANDREREALIGRTANLLTTRMDKYSILVVGQALKSLDGSGITATNWNDVKKTVVNPLDYGGGYYSILATQRMLAHVVRDAWRNEYTVVQMQLLED